MHGLRQGSPHELGREAEKVVGGSQFGSPREPASATPNSSDSKELSPNVAFP